MKRRRRTPRGGLALWADAVQSSWATFTTLSVRVPQLMAGTMTPRESTRMVSEKVAAAAEGTMKGSMAMARIAMRGPRLVTPASLMKDSISVAEAASAPARRRVKANAKRLSVKKP